MANQFFIPFNHDPVSSTRESGTFALPAGTYASIKPIEFNTTLSIDGDVVMPRLTHQIATTTGSATFISVLTCPEGVELRGQLKISTDDAGSPAVMQIIDGFDSSVIYDFNGNQTTGTFSTTSTTFVGDAVNFATDNLALKPGWQIQLRRTNGGTNAFAEISLSAVTFPQYQFWAHGGAGGIDIVGDVFLVELYNSIA